MISATITQTVPPTSILQLREGRNTLAFLQKAASNDIFSGEEKSLIHDLITNCVSETPVHLLIVFLSDILFPAIETSEDEHILTQAESINEEAKSLLKELLPVGTDIEDYINREIKKNQSDLTLLSTAQKVVELIEKKDGELCALGDRINANIDHCHETLKQRLLQIVTIKEMQSAQLIGYSNREVEKINALQEQLKRLTADYQQIGNDYKQQQIHYKKLLEQSDELVRRVRR
jgi:hypothetical protein